MRKALVPDKVFVELYGKSNDRVELVRHLKKFKIFKGRKDAEIKLYASIRAHHLRNAGHELPQWKRGRKPSL